MGHRPVSKGAVSSSIVAYHQPSIQHASPHPAAYETEFGDRYEQRVELEAKQAGQATLPRVSCQASYQKEWHFEGLLALKHSILHLPAAGFVCYKN